MPNFDRATATDPDPDPIKTCPQGHLKTPDNIYFDTDGYPVCRACMLAATKKWRAAHPVDPAKRAEYQKRWREKNADYQRKYRERKSQEKGQGQQP